MRIQLLVALAAATAAMPIARAGAQGTAVAVAKAPRHFFISASAGYTSAEPEGGFAASAGVAAVSRRFFGYLVPVDLTFIPKKPDFRYALETYYTGESFCRDRETGAYVDPGKCSTTPTTRYAAAAEGNFAFVGTASSVFIGAGYRAGFAATPYGTLGFIGRIPYGPPSLARLSIGDQFWQAGVTVHF